MQMIQYQKDNPDNVLVLGIEGGDFDFCQNFVKSLFANPSFGEELENGFASKYSLCSANSINWARLLPQIPFYFMAYKQLLDQTGASCEDSLCFDLCIPTGNF